MFLSFCCYNLGGVGALVKYVWGRCVGEGLRWVGEMRRGLAFFVRVLGGCALCRGNPLGVPRKRESTLCSLETTTLS